MAFGNTNKENKCKETMWRSSVWGKFELPEFFDVWTLPMKN